jgi:hypothetical protein
MISNYYVVSYNSNGKCNLLDSNIKGLSTIIVIECCSRLISTMILKKISNEILSKSSYLEIIHDPIDNNIIEGIIDRKSSIGIFNKCLIENDNIESLGKEQISLNCCYSCESDKIIEIKNNIKAIFDEAIQYFVEAKKIHDDWEQVYVNNIDFTKSDELIEAKINDILQDVSFDKNSVVHERFFGAISANGATNYVEEIIKDKKKRYFIKGRPGTSKSTLLRKLASVASERGIDVDVFYCASDSNSLDMLVFPELDICIFDSTSPHEFFPTKEDDIVIDMYSELLEENFDENNENLLNEIRVQYGESVAKGVSAFKDIYKLYDDLETEYISTIDFDMLSSLYQKVLEIIK